MSTVAYRRALLRKVNQNIDIADRMLAKTKPMSEAQRNYFQGFREAQIEMLCLVNDLEDL